MEHDGNSKKCIPSMWGITAGFLGEEETLELVLRSRG